VPFTRRLGRPHLIALAGLVILALGISAAFFFLRSQASPIHPRLDVAQSNRVRILEPVTVRFDQAVDPSSVRVGIKPATDIRVSSASDRIVISPSLRWEPGQRYTVELHNVRNKQHLATLNEWKTTFQTQPPIGVAGFFVGGNAVSKEAVVPVTSKVLVKFVGPMRPSTVTMAINNAELPNSALVWSEASDQVTVTPPNPVPYQAFVLAVKPGGRTAAGDYLTDTDALSLYPYPQVATNLSSGVGPDFKPTPPIEIVLENTDAAKPQSGLQSSDIAVEYISEYQITRITAIYFNNLPSLIGPIRSCRMANTYLAFAYRGNFMCSGASVGTLHYLFGDATLPTIPGSINDVDHGSHFFRTDSRPAPHNVFTDAGRAQSLRQWARPPGRYVLDPPHPDQDMGEPADPPSVPLHSAGYVYDGGGFYLRYDRGAPLVDAATGSQIHVKNVVLVHVPFRDAGWVEDDNGGAHSVWYEMTGSGPAEIYSNGKLVHATWHLGSPGQWYFENDQPYWFTDEQGRYIDLNSGLTWIHLVGNGQ
jgi:hypothetical protein